MCNREVPVMLGSAKSMLLVVIMSALAALSQGCAPLDEDDEEEELASSEEALTLDDTASVVVKKSKGTAPRLVTRLYSGRWGKFCRNDQPLTVRIEAAVGKVTESSIFIRSVTFTFVTSYPGLRFHVLPSASVSSDQWVTEAFVAPGAERTFLVNRSFKVTNARRLVITAAAIAEVSGQVCDSFQAKLVLRPG
jgi:hypothetical protein